MTEPRGPLQKHQVIWRLFVGGAGRCSERNWRWLVYDWQSCHWSHDSRGCSTGWFRDIFVLLHSREETHERPGRPHTANGRQLGLSWDAESSGIGDAWPEWSCLQRGRTYGQQQPEPSGATWNYSGDPGAAWPHDIRTSWRRSKRKGEQCP